MIIVKIIVINSFIFTLLPFLSGQSRLTITNPKNNEKIYNNSTVPIAWTYRNVQGEVNISYSTNGQDWIVIDVVNVVEKSFGGWYIDNEFYDSNGEIFFKVQSVQYPSIYSTVNLQLPNYTGTVAAVERVDQYVIITKKLDNIRSGPAPSYSIIGKCRKDELYDYLGEEGNWYIIRYNNEVAYTHKTNGTMFSYSDKDYYYDVARELFWYCILPLFLLVELLSN